jgi:hypothetical protein
MRKVRTARSRFLLRELSLVNTEHPKYPRQPVVECDSYRHKSEAKPDAPGDPPTQPT